MFIAAGQEGIIVQSADGNSWEPANEPTESLVYRLAAFGNDTFAVLGSRGRTSSFAASSTGKDWEVETKDLGYKDIARGLAFGNGQFLAFIGNPGSPRPEPHVSLSKKGSDWSKPVPISGKQMLQQAVYGNGIWAAIGDRGRYSYSTDGLEWENVPGTRPLDTMIAITFANGRFVATGLHGSRRYSDDGKRWSEPEEGLEGEHINSVLWTGSAFVGIGDGATYASQDGKAWERVPNKNAPTFATYGNGLFVGISYKGIIRISRDAIEWEQVHKAKYNFETITYGAV